MWLLRRPRRVRSASTTSSLAPVGVLGERREPAVRAEARPGRVRRRAVRWASATAGRPGCGTVSMLLAGASPVAATASLAGRPAAAPRARARPRSSSPSDGRPPFPPAAVELDRGPGCPRSPPPPPRATRRSTPAAAGRARRSGASPATRAGSASSASRAGMSRWLVGSSSSSRFAGAIPSSASSSRDRSPPDSSATGVNTSSPRNRNRARYPRASPDPRSTRSSSASRTVSPGNAASLAAGRGSRAARRARSDDAVEREELPRHRPQQRRLAGAVRPDDPDAVAPARPRGAEPAGWACPRRPGAAGTRRRHPGRETTMSPDRTGAAPDQGALRELHRAARSGRLDLPDRRQPPLVLVHLRVVAVAAVVLDQLRLAGRGVLRRSACFPAARRVPRPAPRRRCTRRGT